MHILFVTFSVCVPFAGHFIIGPLLLNASLLVVLTTDYRD